ncbi:10375_t:CDS:1, partial [Scutellospora calospora]
MEGVSDSEEETDNREYPYHNVVTNFTTTEDEEDEDEEMDVCTSDDSETDETENEQITQNIHPVQNQRFEG